MIRHTIRALTVALCVAAAATVSTAATRYDPALRFRSIATPHFVIHYHQGEEALARRLARLTEDVHATLTLRMGHVPRGRTHVVLVDQTDRPNGWATPVPYNLIEITATQPPGESLIGNTDDWLRLVFTHEYAHVLHLDRSRGWAWAARAVFGRTPFAFPNLTLPLFHIEGLATWEESAGGGGRVEAGDFRAIVGRAARADEFEPLDRVSGGLLEWPSGYGWYAYGALFHEYLSDRFGAERFRELSDRTAGRLPWLNVMAFEPVFGASLGQLWREFEAEQRRRARGGDAERQPPERLTFDGFLVSGPRFDHEGAVIYTHTDPHGFPTIRRLAPGSPGPVHVIERLGGERLAVSGDTLVFDQPERARNVAMPSDLYLLDRSSGTVHRATREARLVEPDISPDGRRLAAIVLRPGRRSLVVLDLPERVKGPPLSATTIESAIVLGGDDVAYATPRWSPDGRRVAIERRGLHGPSSIVVWEAETGRERFLAATRGRVVTPTWTPDGRAVLFALAEAPENFDLYRLWLDDTGGPAGLERLTELPGGARSPEVSSDGRWVVFVGYTPQGYDLFRLALPPSPGPPREPLLHAASPLDAAAAAPAAGATSSAQDKVYSPWSTLWPRAWEPVIEWDDDEVRVGGFVAAQDVLGRHSWSARLSWSVSRAEELEPVSPGARPDVNVSYAYDRWRPTLFASYGDETTPLLAPRENGSRRPVSVRERGLDAGAYIPLRRIRRTHTLLAAWHADRTEIAGPEDDGTLQRSAARLAWSFDSTQRFGYSISPERGTALGVATELTREALGADADGTFTRADARVYLPLGPRHAVLALRASGATFHGDSRVARVPRLGGHTGDVAVLSFDEEASSLLRGFPGNTFFGRHLALANAEYRIPLAWIERGIGTWPAFVRGVYVNGFVDVGHAWTGTFRAADRKWSWGAELGTETVLGYGLPLSIVAGAGWGRDGAGEVPDNREFYVRIGRSF